MTWNDANESKRLDDIAVLLRSLHHRWDRLSFWRTYVGNSRATAPHVVPIFDSKSREYVASLIDSIWIGNFQRTFVITLIPLFPLSWMIAIQVQRSIERVGNAIITKLATFTGINRFNYFYDSFQFHWLYEFLFDRLNDCNPWSTPRVIKLNGALEWWLEWGHSIRSCGRHINRVIKIK